ncbi:hypothetical protein GJAV_G00140430 [Gymnothorax javanicus]|nr:hypothetical protein GJAV_G00140430 [Gymnothorax javanicus]
MDILPLALILLAAFGGVINQVHLEPKYAAVLRGSDARFNCSLSQPDWVVMSWLLNNSLVLTISKVHGVLENNNRFNATNYTTDGDYKWEFVLKNSQLNESSEVTCAVQNIDRKIAILTVQESGSVTITSGNLTVVRNQPATIHCRALNWFPAPNLTWTWDGMPVSEDNYSISTVAAGELFNTVSTLRLLANSSARVECQAKVPALAEPESSTIFLTVVPEPPEQDQTVLIAVVVSVVAVAVLVLLIIGIIFCYRRRAAESSYADEVRKKRTLSEANASEGVQGRENMAYLPDGRKQAVADPSEFNGSVSADSAHASEMPDAIFTSTHAAQEQNPSPVMGGPGTLENRKHRLATIV